MADIHTSCSGDEYTEISYSMVRDGSPDRVLCPATPESSQEIIYSPRTLVDSPRQMAKRSRRSLDDVVNDAVNSAISKRFKPSDLREYDHYMQNKERDSAILALQLDMKNQDQKMIEQDQKIFSMEKEIKVHKAKIQSLEDQILELQAIIMAKDLKLRDVLDGCRSNLTDFSNKMEKLF